MNHVNDKDKGFKRILELFRRNKKPASITVGIHQEEGNAQHGSMTVAEIAAVHEYGSSDGTIPQRSFVRDTHDENLQSNLALLKLQEERVLAGHLTQHQACALLGEVASKQMVSKINAGISPANAPSTIRRKKSSKPLIDTGQLKGAISFRVKGIS